RLCHSIMWLFHLHSTLKLQLFYPVFPLAESTAKTFCWLSLWNFKEKASTFFYGTAKAKNPRLRTTGDFGKTIPQTRN
ncbi:hypothetical protein, partial [uncultured Bilophila sp.]|uniref:hypothetical protein n=1 Tax=uncultured Bilophila sp. TaxID=529385 RepID=UPI00280AC9BA